MTKLCKGDLCSSPLYAKGLCNRHYLQTRKFGLIVSTNADPRPAIIKGDIAKIPLGIDARNGYAIIDKKFAYLDKYKWNLHHGYVSRGSKGREIYLHKEILGISENLTGDHINHDKLDNRLSNLRECTQGQNNFNRKRFVHNSNRYKGITFQNGAFAASIGINYKRIYLGRYKTQELAAKAYDKAAKKYHGEFARLNFYSIDVDN